MDAAVWIYLGFGRAVHSSPSVAVLIDISSGRFSNSTIDGVWTHNHTQSLRGMSDEDRH